MYGVLRVLKAKDEQHFKFSKLVLNMNHNLAVAGPTLAGVAGMATIFIGEGGKAGVWASGAAALDGTLAAAVNKVLHEEQVDMVFELFRNCTRFYHKVHEEIEACLSELEAERGENDEVFQTKEVVCAAQEVDAVLVAGVAPPVHRCLESTRWPPR
jgi:hypothetical protein